MRAFARLAVNQHLDIHFVIKDEGYALERPEQWPDG